MRLARFAFSSLVAISLSACSEPPPERGTPGDGSDPGIVTAETLGAQVVLPTEDYLELPEYRNADAGYGARLAMQCRACHSFEQGGPAISGPNLYDFFGRRAGDVDDYPYSPVLAEADFFWTPEALDAWLAQPRLFLPGNRMAYQGLPDQLDRNALIAALLRQATGATADNVR